MADADFCGAGVARDSVNLRSNVAVSSFYLYVILTFKWLRHSLDYPSSNNFWESSD